MHFLKSLFSYDFLFYINRVRLERVDKLFLALSVVAIILAILLWVWRRLDKHEVRRSVTKRLFRLVLTFGLVGTFWFAMRYELVAWVGTHAAFLLLIACSLIWAGFIVSYIWTSYRHDCKEWEHRQLKEKYLKMAA